MYSFSFPPEIWLSISIYLDLKEYLELVLVCRAFYQIFIASLYSTLLIAFPPNLSYYTVRLDRLDATDPARFAPAGPRFEPLLKRLDTHPTLRNYVRRVSIKNLKLRFSSGLEETYPNQSLHDRLVWAVINLLRNLPILQKVEFTDFDMGIECLVSIASHLTKHLDICVTHGNLYGGPPVSTSSRMITARSLMICGQVSWPYNIEGLHAFVLASSMRKLDLGLLPWHNLHVMYMDAGKPQLSHLESLTIPYIGLGELHILSAMTNLRELIFGGRGQVWHIGVGNIPPGKGTTGVLKELEVIATHSSLVFPFTAGRRIEEIRTLDTPDSNIDLSDFGPRFGSEVMVRKVEWKSCGRVDMVVDYVVTKNLGVWHLTVEPIWYGGDLQAISISQAELSVYILKIVLLRELRTLRLTHLRQAPTRRSLLWEEEQCRYLRRAGCPLLVSVAFREELTWTRHPDDETLWRPSGAWAGVWGRIG